MKTCCFFLAFASTFFIPFVFTTEQDKIKTTEHNWKQVSHSLQENCDLFEVLYTHEGVYRCMNYLR